VLRLYVQVPSVSSVSIGVLGGVEQGVGKVGGASVGEAAAEDKDQVLPAERLGRARALRAKAAFIRGGGSSSASMASIRYSAAWLGATQARLFFFDFADLAVDLVARGFGQGVEEFLEAFGLPEFACERGVDGQRHRKDFSGWI